MQYESLSTRDEHDVKPSTTTGKRTLTTKNVGTSEKRKRKVSSSGATVIKREPQVELNDEVSRSLSREAAIAKSRGRMTRKTSAPVVVDVAPPNQPLGNATDPGVSSRLAHRRNIARTSVDWS